MRTRDELGASDLIASGLTACVALLLLVFPLFARPFRAMYTDMGGALPFVTRAATTWLGPLVGVATASALAASFRATTIGRRRLWIVAAFFVGIVGFAGCLTALYWPIFALAGNVKAE